MLPLPPPGGHTRAKDQPPSGEPGPHQVRERMRCGRSGGTSSTRATRGEALRDHGWPHAGHLKLHLSQQVEVPRTAVRHCLSSSRATRSSAVSRAVYQPCRLTAIKTSSGRPRLPAWSQPPTSSATSDSRASMAARSPVRSVFRRVSRTTVSVSATMDCQPLALDPFAK